jgi:hypothetical protein
LENFQGEKRQTPSTSKKFRNLSEVQLEYGWNTYCLKSHFFPLECLKSYTIQMSTTLVLLFHLNKGFTTWIEQIDLLGNVILFILKLWKDMKFMIINDFIVE